MNRVDPWIHVLEQLEPDYHKLKDTLNTGPKIFADLSQRGRWWCITLQEDPNMTFNFPSTGKLDERVDWTVGQLADWPNIKRMAHDMWYFKYKRDAEKFQTLYNLKWASE
jgi:hypothetical protein